MHKATQDASHYYSDSVSPSTPYTMTATPTQPHTYPLASFPKRAVTSQDANLLCGELEAGQPVSPPNWAGLARALYNLNFQPYGNLKPVLDFKAEEFISRLHNYTIAESKKQICNCVIV